MLPRPYRLTNSNYILLTIRKGKTRSCPYFRLKYRLISRLPGLKPGSSSDQNIFSNHTQPPTVEPTRFAFVCSKKQLKRAVDRNRVQRRLRAQITPLLPQLKPGYQVVFLIQAAALDATTQELQTAVHSQLKELISEA